jgi:predicted dienelactone hydrolase
MTTLTTLRVPLVGCAIALLSACVAAPARDGRDTVPAIESVSLELDDAVRTKSLPTRVTYPLVGKDLPVVLFSHGAYSSKDLYAPIADAWARAGFVVIQPTHMDSVSLGVARGTSNPAFWPERLADMRFLLSSLKSLAQKIPALAGRVDGTRVAATGHSFGGMVAQTIGGASYFDPGSGQTVRNADTRVRAVIIMSGAGRFAPLLRAEDFAALALPTLVSVGTNDLKQDPTKSGYEWRKEPYDFLAPGDKYLLTLSGADHYLGGSVGRDDLPRDPNAAAYLAAFTDVSTRFLRAYVMGDTRANTDLRASSPATATLVAK